MRSRLLSCLLLFAVASAVGVGGGCGSGSGSSGPLHRDEWTEACTRLIACHPGVVAQLTVTACAATDPPGLAALPASYRDAARCANKASGDCAAILACFDDGEPTTGCDTMAPSYCLPNGKHWQCYAGVALVRDCVPEELTCLPATPGGAVCGTVACTAAEPPACLGAMLLECRDGVMQPTACPPGAACSAASGTARCEGAGAPCPPAQQPSCTDGSTLVTCVGDHEAIQHCAADDYRRRCDDPLPAAEPATCVGIDGECTPATFVDRCNGGRLEYCEDGRVRGLDCRALGFEGCQPGDAMGGASRCIAADVPMADGGIGDGGVDAGPDAALSDGGP